MLDDLWGNIVLSALERTAAAHKPICFWLTFALRQLLEVCSVETRVFLGSWNTSCCLSGALDGAASTTLAVSLVPEHWDKLEIEVFCISKQVSLLFSFLPRI